MSKKIVSLKVVDFLGIESATIENAKKINIIKGGNEIGKSGVIESIEKTLNNRGRRTRLVRDGASEALLLMEIEGDGDKFEVDRRIRNDKSDYFVVKKDGVAIKSPESALKKMFNSFAFNPVDFLSMDDKEKSEAIIGLIEMVIDEKFCVKEFGEVLKDINLGRHGVEVLKDIADWYYKKRTEVNAEIKSLKNRVKVLSEKLPADYDGEYWKAQSLKEAIEALAKANKVNSFIAKAKNIVNNEDAHQKALENNHNAIKLDIEKMASDNKKHLEKSITDNKIRMETINGEIKRLVESKKNEYSDTDMWLSKEIDKLRVMAEDKKKAIDDKYVIKKDSLNIEKQELTGEISTSTAELKNIDAITEEKIKSEVARYNESTTEFSDNHRKAKEYLETHPETLDIEELTKTVDEVDSMRNHIPSWEIIQQIKLGELAQKQEQANDLTTKIEHARELPALLLMKAVKPIDGIGVDENLMVTYHKLPLDAMSTEQSMKFAIAVARSLASDSDLKIICIDRFESFDDDKKEMFLREIEDDDYQYFITQVTNGNMVVESYTPKTTPAKPSDEVKGESVVSVSMDDMSFDLEED